MKKSLLFFVFFCFSASFVFAQLKVYPTGVTKIGSTSRTPTLKRGLEVEDTVLIGSSLLIHLSNEFQIQPPIIGKSNIPTFYHPVIRGVQANSLQIGTPASYIAKVYATRLYSPNGIQITSDRRAKENIRSIPSALESVKMLRPVYYDFINNEEANMDTATLKDNVGFIAQEVLQVFPQAVGYMNDIDLYTMDYSAIIPFLTKAIQEQQEQIELLQNRVQELSQTTQYAAPSSGSQPQEKNASFDNLSMSAKLVDGVGASKLFQNTPNPFSESTKIAYIVDEKATSAQICIYNLNGTQLKCYNIQPSGAGEIEIKGSELQAGMYIYGIIVNGVMVDSKRMVLTN